MSKLHTEPNADEEVTTIKVACRLRPLTAREVKAHLNVVPSFFFHSLFPEKLSPVVEGNKSDVIFDVVCGPDGGLFCCVMSKMAISATPRYQHKLPNVLRVQDR